ncbi:MAG: hypothetical protein KA218_05965 [Arenimonas sp.]|nr:hypothetical protein [Arenimonas sp.]MBP7981666.1 hypothetical protein [Arenimonas sp.]
MRTILAKAFLVFIAAALSGPHALATEPQAVPGGRPAAISAGLPGPGTLDLEAIPEVFKIKRARFQAEPASSEARHVADWVVVSGDNQRRPFVIIDKTAAKVFVFDAGGSLLRAAPALLGLAERDDDEPGVGALPLSGIRPEIRTTPAGRFVAQMGRNLKGQDILWVDYASGLSLHRVVTGNKVERRQERLDSPTPRDNRISFGCINVPVPFFDEVVKPVFAGLRGVVYVLPETRPASEVFGSYAVDAD